MLSTSLWATYPPDSRWEKIQTEHFNIIFDSRLGEYAQIIANDLENFYFSLTDGMGGVIDRYTIVLPADLIKSNGYVQPTKNKSVFYPVAPLESFSGTSAWYHLLTIHETRHMAQYSHIRNSVVQRILRFLFGSNGVLGATLIPSYFYEGDAVLTETLLSESGRGRSPGFEMGFRTILLTDKDFSFAKALHGSERDYIPNYYVLGYYLMTYLKREYGSDILQEIVNLAGNNPFPMNFSTASLFITGESMPRIYNNVRSELKTLWTTQDELITPTVTKSLGTPSSKYFTNMKYPKLDKNGNLYYIESGIDINSRLIEVTDGHSTIHEKVTGNFSLFNSNVVFTEESSDPRWIYKGYSDIYKYNLNTGVKIALTRNERYFNPVYSSHGDKIAVIEISQDRTPSIVILDSFSGDVISTKNFPRGEMISGLSWSKDDTLITLSSISKAGCGLGIYNIDENDFSYITNIDNIEKSFPKFYGNSILFVSSISGINNINTIDLSTLDEFQVISSRFGVDFPFIINDTMVFSDYTADGYRARSFELKSGKRIPVLNVKNGHVDYFKPLLADVFGPGKSFNDYTVKKYNPHTNLFDIHSWIVNPFMPLLSKSEIFNSSVDTVFDVPEIILFSNDYLEYMDATFYSHYNRRSEAFDSGGYGVFRGLYPGIIWDINLFSEGVEKGLSTFHTTFNFQVPQLFSDRRYSVGIIPDYFCDLRDEDLTYFDLSYYLSYDYFKNRTSFSSAITLTQGIHNSSKLSLGLSTNLTIPGIFNHDNLIINTESIWGLGDDTPVSGSEISRPQSALMAFNRVYSSFLFYNKIEYNLPLFYPDISIFNWIYFSAFDLYAGYESFYSKNTEYYHLVNSRLSLSYYILRVPISFQTEFNIYYDINNGKPDYIFSPITFNYGLDF